MGIAKREGSGRKKGSQNILGAQVKENIVAVFNKLNGTAGMADWAKDNLTEFYKLYARLIPTELHTTVDFRDASQLSDSELAAIATAGRIGADGAASGESEPGSVH